MFSARPYREVYIHLRTPMKAVPKLLCRPRPHIVGSIVRSPKALTSKPSAEALVTQLAARQFDKVEAQFDDQMKAALPVTQTA